MKRWYAIMLVSTALCAKSDRCLLSQIKTILVNIRNQMSVQSECATTPIAAPATITAPGSYCLDNNSTGAITIASNNVALNLNNHSLGAVNIGAFREVTVFNGFVEGGSGITLSGSTNVELAYLQMDSTTSNGITINNASSAVAIHDVIISNAAANGIELTGGSFNITIKDVLVTGATATGIDFESTPGARDVFIESTVVYNCGARGFRLGEGASIINCVAAYNNGNGIRFQAANSIEPNAASMYAQDCVAMNNADDGVHIIGGKVTLVNVTAINNGNGGLPIENRGFYVTSEATVMFEGCIAESNVGDGFLIDDSPSSTGTIRGCSAINNGGFGFEDQGNGIIYINNIASSNNGGGLAQNYSAPAATAPFYSRSYTAIQDGTESFVSYWTNVAALTTP